MNKPNLSHNQDEPLMPMSPQDRVRQRVVDSLLPQIAELLYRCDKGHRMAQLSDLEGAELAVYVADALLITDADARAERVKRLNAIRAHGHALAEDEQRTVERQARKDVVFYGPRALYPVCEICDEPVITNRVELLLSPSIKAVAHGLCCAKDEAQYEFVSEFFYQKRGL